jgi:hypothetical protein
MSGTDTDESTIRAPDISRCQVAAEHRMGRTKQTRIVADRSRNSLRSPHTKASIIGNPVDVAAGACLTGGDCRDVAHIHDPRDTVGCLACIEESSAMSSGTGDGLTYVALGLATVVAIMSVRLQGGDPDQKVLWLLETIGAAEPAAMATPVGENPEFPVSP